MLKANLKKSHIKTPYHCGDLMIKIVETVKELRDAKWVRIRVFQREQGINIARDFDDKDPESIHIVAYLAEMPVGTARMRLLEDGAGKIERVAVLKEFRKRGIGKQLIKYALYVLKSERIKIARLSSQKPVKNFYKQFGFSEFGDVFDDAGIRHIMMEKIL